MFDQALVVCVFPLSLAPSSFVAGPLRVRATSDAKRELAPFFNRLEFGGGSSPLGGSRSASAPTPRCDSRELSPRASDGRPSGAHAWGVDGHPMLLGNAGQPLVIGDEDIENLAQGQCGSQVDGVQ